MAYCTLLPPLLLVSSTTCTTACPAPPHQSISATTPKPNISSIYVYSSLLLGCAFGGFPLHIPIQLYRRERIYTAQVKGTPWVLVISNGNC